MYETGHSAVIEAHPFDKFLAIAHVTSSRDGHPIPHRLFEGPDPRLGPLLERLLIADLGRFYPLTFHLHHYDEAFHPTAAIAFPIGFAELVKGALAFLPDECPVRERHRIYGLHFGPDALQVEGNPRTDAPEANENGEEEPVNSRARLHTNEVTSYPGTTKQTNTDENGEEEP